MHIHTIHTINLQSYTVISVMTVCTNMYQNVHVMALVQQFIKSYGNTIYTEMLRKYTNAATQVRVCTQPYTHTHACTHTDTHTGREM